MTEPEQSSLLAIPFLSRAGRKKFTFRAEALLVEHGKLHTVVNATDQPYLLYARVVKRVTAGTARARLPHRIPQTK
jgi:hypothetical protein